MNTSDTQSNKFATVLAYIASIVLVNWAFTVLPMVEVFGTPVPATSLVVGLIFVARDFAQRAIGHYVLFAMLVGTGLSYLMADPFVATASLAAFLISEVVDWAVYTFTKRPFHQRILLSSALSTPVDSIVFLSMIGFFSLPGVVLMTIAKMIGAVIVAAGYASRQHSSRK
jgi:queuosine precursor transporter